MDDHQRHSDNTEDRVWELLDNAEKLKVDKSFNQGILDKIETPSVSPKSKRILRYLVPLAASAMLMVGITLFQLMRPEPIGPHSSDRVVKTEDIPVIEAMELLDNMDMLEGMKLLDSSESASLFVMLAGEGGEQ